VGISTRYDRLESLDLSCCDYLRDAAFFHKPLGAAEQSGWN